MRHDPRKARLKQRTNKDTPDASLAGLLVRQQPFVRFEAGKPNRHLRHNAGEDGPKTLVECEGGLPLHDVGTGCKESPRLRLYRS
jgi:hypothetical protein